MPAFRFTKPYPHEVEGLGIVEPDQVVEADECPHPFFEPVLEGTTAVVQPPAPAEPAPETAEEA